MAESSTQINKLEWKWVGIVFSLLLLFYLLPILVAGGAFVRHPDYVVGSAYESPAVHGPKAFFIGSWYILGVIIITAVPAFFAKKSLLWESEISAFLLAIAWFIVYYSHAVSQGLGIFEQSAHSRDLAPSTKVTIIAVVVFLLSLFGAWLGERLRKALKTKPPQPI